MMLHNKRHHRLDHLPMPKACNRRQGFKRPWKVEDLSEVDEDEEEVEEEARKPTSPHGDDALRNEERRRQRRIEKIPS